MDINKLWIPKYIASSKINLHSKLIDLCMMDDSYD